VSCEPSDAHHLSKDGNDRFTLVSIVDWFKRSQIIPQLQKMLDLKPIKALVKEIKSELNKEDSTPQTFLGSLENHAKKATHLLNITHPEGVMRLVALVMTVDQFIKQKVRIPLSEEKDMLLLRLFTGSVGLYESIDRNAEFKLKRMVEQKPLFSMEFIADFIDKKFNLDDNDWCSYLKFHHNQENKMVEDKTHKAESIAVTIEPKRKSERNSSNGNKLKPHNSTELSKKPASSLKERRCRTKASSQKHVTFTTESLGAMQADESNNGYPHKRIRSTSLTSPRGRITKKRSSKRQLQYNQS
jgi:hypothetical protein